MRLAIAYVHPGWVHEAFATSLRRYCTLFPNTVVMAGRSGPTLARSRNEILHAFIDRKEADTLLWVDTDMIFTSDDVNDLLENCTEETPIISSLCYGYDYNLNHAFVACRPELDEDEIDGEIHEVKAVGMAFTAMSYDTANGVVEEYPFPYREMFDPDLGLTGEDVGFCLMARNFGYASFVHTGIHTPHIKETTY